jgi:hypothetical protein
VPHGALLPGETPETRAKFVADLQTEADRQYGRAVSVGALPPENSRIVIAGLQANQDPVRRIARGFHGLDMRASLCLRGFDSVTFIAFYESGKRYETLESFTTDAGDAEEALKTEGIMPK